MTKIMTSYNDILYDFLGLPTEKLNRHMRNVMENNIDNCRILEIASGKPQIASVYSALGAKHLSFIDNDPQCFTDIASEFTIETDIFIQDILGWDTLRQYDAIHIGDNSISIFNSFEAQHLLIKKALSLLRKDGVLYLNVVPVEYKKVNRFSKQFGYIENYYVYNEEYKLYGKADIDFFFQKLVLYFALYKDTDLVYESEIDTRFMTTQEILDIVIANGGAIKAINKQAFGDNISIYYIIEKAWSLPA